LVKTDPETWKPTLKASKETHQANKDQENEQFNMEYKAELDKAMKRKRMYNDDLFKAYASYGKFVPRGCRTNFLPVQTMKMKYTSTQLSS